MAGRGEMWGASRDVVVCPKPTRLHSSNDHFRPSRLYTIRRAEIADSKAGTELLDLIFTEGGYGATELLNNQMSCSPPFFCGSPPSRASNPLIQDSQFQSNETRPFLAAPLSPTAQKGGSCGQVSHTSATVRIEGFDCLNQDRRSVSAVA